MNIIYLLPVFIWLVFYAGAKNFFTITKAVSSLVVGNQAEEVAYSWILSINNLKIWHTTAVNILVETETSRG